MTHLVHGDTEGAGAIEDDSAPASLGLRQIIRYEPYSNGSFGDSGCDPVHGARADVACGEDAWDRGLEKHWFASFVPCFGKCLGDGDIASGQDETFGIAQNGRR